MNLFRDFKKDFGLAVYNDIQRTSKTINLKYVGIYGILITIYILSKPIFITYMGNMEKKVRLEKIKAEGKFCLDENEMNQIGLLITYIINKNLILLKNKKSRNNF